MKVINLKTLIVLLLAIVPHISAKECVVLLHGMARGNGSMSEIETVLSDSGYTVVNHDYPSTKATIQVLAAKELPKAIGNCPTDVTINFVTHSLGGIILRQFLSTDTLINIGRVVMLGPPNKGSEVVDNLGDWKVFEFVNGPAGTQLGTEKSSVPNTIGPAHFEVGIIAGTSTVNPILSTMLPNPDDGKVSVENTKLEGMKDHITMAVTHTFMMTNDAVINQVVFFLRNGVFNKAIDK